MVQNSQKGCGVKSNEGFKDSLYSLFDVKTEEAKVQTQLLKSLLSFIFLCFVRKALHMWNSVSNFHLTGWNNWYIYIYILIRRNSKVDLDKLTLFS